MTGRAGDMRGTANRRRTLPVEVRFLRKVLIGDDCWEWVASRDAKGYGQFHDGIRSRKAHAYSYEIFIGPIPEGQEPDHLCRNRACVRPDHLEAVTHRVNSQRAQYSKTHCAAGHELPPPGLNGRRVCRPCANARNQKYKAAKAIYEAVMGR